MKEKLFKNLSLKILSAVFAFVLWTMIVNIYDPTTSYTFSNVTVQLINTENLTDKNYSYEVVEGSKISVFVSGPQSVVTNIKASDIVATADLSNISAFADYVDIKVSVVKDGQTLTNVEVTPKTTAVKLNIENRETKTLEIESVVSGQPADGYAMVNESFNPTSIKITGPSSVVEAVDKAAIEFDVTGATSDIYGTANIALFDGEGNRIEDDDIEYTQKEVDYLVKIFKTKSVPIEVKTQGNPANDCVVSSIDLSANAVTVYGDESKLKGLDKIVIPPDHVIVEGLSANKTFKYNLTDLIDSSFGIIGNARVEITVNIQKKGAKNIILNTSDITVSGLSDTFSMSFDDKTYSIEVEGSQELVDKLDTSKIVATLNLKGVEAGKKNLSVDVKLPEGYSLKNKPSVSVTVTLKSANNSTTTNTNSTSNTGNTNNTDSTEKPR